MIVFDIIYQMLQLLFLRCTCCLKTGSDALRVSKQCTIQYANRANVLQWLLHIFGTALLFTFAASRKITATWCLYCRLLNSWSINFSDNVLKCYVFALVCPLCNISLWYMCWAAFASVSSPFFLSFFDVSLCNSVSVHFDDFMKDIWLACVVPQMCGKKLKQKDWDWFASAH